MPRSRARRATATIGRRQQFRFTIISQLVLLMLLQLTGMSEISADGNENGNPQNSRPIETGFVMETEQGILKSETLDNKNVKKEEPMFEEQMISETDQKQAKTLAEQNSSTDDLKQEIKIEHNTLTEDATVSPQSHQKQLQEEHPHQKRNYASKDCGAKVLYSNEEAENKNAILNDPERDDYMRNPCERAQNKFLIIELCETIQPTSLDIANFELFSSNPKNFRLWGSERYPTQEWALLGEFEAQDTREIQSFNVQEHPAYAKFVKLELLTHHGKEHFCTLSTFRLYGISMVDEYEAEASSTGSLQHKQLSPQIDPVTLDNQQEMDTDAIEMSPNNVQRNNKPTNGEEDPLPLYEDYENNTGDAAAECTIEEESAQDTLIRKATTKVHGIHKAEAQIEEVSNSENNIPVKEKQLTEEVEPEKSRREGEEQKKEASTGVLNTIVELGSNLLGQAFSKKAVGENGTTGEGKQQNGQELAGRKAQLWRRSLFHQNPSASCRLCPRNPHLRQCNMFCRTFLPQIAKNNLNSALKWEVAKRAKKARLEFLDRVLRRQTASFCPLPSTPMTCKRKSEGVAQNGQQQSEKSRQPTAQQRQEIGNGKQQAEQDTNGQLRQNGQQMNGVGNGNGNSANKQQQIPPQKPVAPSIVGDKGNLRPLPGTSTNHKESVFMKLNKRLTALEQNMSVSSEHLSELSRRYGTQADEIAKQQEKLAKAAEQVAKQESQRVEGDMKQRMSELQREVHRLSQQLQAVTNAVQTGGGNGFFYRPFLTPIHGIAASDSEIQKHCHDVPLTNGGIDAVAPLHSTSAFASSVLHKNQEQEEKGARDGLWTTNQVICLMALMQICTLVLLKLVRTIRDRIFCSTASLPVTSTQNLNRQQQQILMNFNPRN